MVIGGVNQVGAWRAAGLRVVYLWQPGPSGAEPPKWYRVCAASPTTHSDFHGAVTRSNAFDAMVSCSFGDGCYLRAEMARKNMYMRDDRPAKAFRAEAPSPQVPGNSPYPSVDRNSDNPPCDTLFVGNLPPHVSEDEVEDFFRNAMGNSITACKVNRNASGRVSAFVQFADIEVAKEAHSSMQGKELPGSDRGPMRIQFSKNALGKRRRDEERALQAGGGPAYGSQDAPGGFDPVEQPLQPMPTGADAPPPDAPGGLRCPMFPSPGVAADQSLHVPPVHAELGGGSHGRVTALPSACMMQ